MKMIRDVSNGSNELAPFTCVEEMIPSSESLSRILWTSLVSRSSAKLREDVLTNLGGL